MTAATASSPFAAALARSRETFNARFLAARHANPKLDGEAFLAHLGATVEPIVRAASAEFEERADAITTTLYDLSLELFGLGLLGPQARHAAVVDLWRHVLPAVPRLVAHDPVRVAGSLCNAAYNLAVTPGARADEWVSDVAAVGPRCEDVQTLLACGKVLAWRRGMAHHRDGAISAARGLPAPVAALALGLPEGTAADAVRSTLDRVADDAWLTPADAMKPPRVAPRVRVVARAGAFRGFGGPFLRPPVVDVQHGQFTVTDGEAVWTLKADAFGAVFLRGEPAPAERAPARPGPPPLPARLRPDGVIEWPGGRTARLPDDLPEPTSHASDGRTLAVTIRSSHHVFLMAAGGDV